MNNINDLRSELRKRMAAVNRKMRRHERERGIEDWGRYDIRVPTDRINKLNRRQLQVAIDRANSFMNRRTQFVANIKDEAVGKSLYQEYINAAKQFNKRLAAKRAKWDKKTLGKLGLRDIEIERMTNKGVWSHLESGSYNKHGFEVLAKPEQFHSEAGLKKKIKALRTKLTKEQQNRERREFKRELNKLAESLSSPELRKAVQKLSGQQLDYVMDSPAIMNALKLAYTIAYTNRNNNSNDFLDIEETETREALGYLDIVNREIDPRSGRLRDDD